MWRPNTAKNPTKSCAKALTIFATCSWPSLCEQSELQCWRRNRRLCGPAQISAARTLLPISTVLSQVAWRLRRCKGHRRTFGEGLRRSTVAHFARKVRGDEYCGGQTRLKIQQSHALKRCTYSLRVRGPHFASKVSYNAGAATDDYAGQRKSPQRGRCCQYLIFYLEHPPIKVIVRRKKPREVDFVICSRPQFARFAAASSATAGRE